MSLHLIARSSSPARVTRRIAVGAALIAVGYGVALVVSPSIQLPSSVSVGNAAAVKHAAERPASPAPASADNASPPDFDYFPDHYKNQAREPSEPTDTF
jgi:hypothetical protein